MCLAIAIKKGAAASIPEDYLKRGFNFNSDGAGIAYYTGGKVRIEKGFMAYDHFFKRYSEVITEFPNAPMLVHFRAATLGEIATVNCHPFRFKGGVFIHNGHLTGLGYGGKDIGSVSDTHHFSKLIHDLPARAIPEFTDQLSGELRNTFNIMAFLSNEGNLSFVNEKKGHWDGDVWYSNSCYKPQGVGNSRYGED